MVADFALADTYFATGGNTRTIRDNWMTIATACAWNGVYCHKFGEIATELDPPGNN